MSHIFTLFGKKVNALGKMSAHADDEPECFFLSGLMVLVETKRPFLSKSQPELYSRLTFLHFSEFFHKKRAFNVVSYNSIKFGNNLSCFSL